MIPVTPLVLADIYFYQDEDTTDTDGSKFNMSKNDGFKPLFVLFWPVHQDFSGSCSFENCFCNARMWPLQCTPTFFYVLECIKKSAMWCCALKNSKLKDDLR